MAVFCSAFLVIWVRLLVIVFLGNGAGSASPPTAIAASTNTGEMVIVYRIRSACLPQAHFSESFPVSHIASLVRLAL